MCTFGITLDTYCICVLFYVWLWTSKPTLSYFYKRRNGSFSIVIVIHVCSISMIVFSILHFIVLWMLGSVQQMLSCVYSNEWYVCIIWKHGCVYQMKTRVPFWEQLIDFMAKSHHGKGESGFSILCVMFSVLCVQFWVRRYYLEKSVLTIVTKIDGFIYLWDCKLSWICILMTPK